MGSSVVSYAPAEPPSRGPVFLQVSAMPVYIFLIALLVPRLFVGRLIPFGMLLQEGGCHRIPRVKADVGCSLSPPNSQ